MTELERLGLSGRSLLPLDRGNDAEDNFAHFGESMLALAAVRVARLPG